MTMDTEKFKKEAALWIEDAIAANGGVEVIEAHRLVPQFIEVLILGWAAGRWSASTHPQRFTQEELRRMHDLVRLRLEKLGTTS